MSTSARRIDHGVARRGVRVACIALASLVALAGCGGSGKPGYCSARANLENSIKGLTSLNVSSGISGLEAQLSKIKTAAGTLVSQAKSDFPSETSAITSSVNALESSVKSLSGTPSAGEIATVASGASGVVSSVKSFVDASNSKCS